MTRNRQAIQVFDSPRALRQALGPCVATIGKYDGMHLGHQHILATLLQQARRLALPAVVVLSEPQPEEFFSPQSAAPRLNHFLDKVDFLADFGIDAVLRLQFDASISQCPAQTFVREFLLQELGMKALVVGDDFRFGHQRQGDFSLLQQLAGNGEFTALSVAPCSNAGERVSSTLIRHYLYQGECMRAAELLGRPYSIGGKVVLGRQLGRQLGVPTANVEILTPMLPMTGVFAVTATWQENEYKGVANLGYKPTVSDAAVPSLEVHLFEFDRDIYGDRLKVHFHAKIRDEHKFGSLDELKQQIAEDIMTARQVLA
jgi:riboflavin kinase / FMN adenylyltransferase